MVNSWPLCKHSIVNNGISNKNRDSSCFKVSYQTRMNNSSESVNMTQATPQVCSSTNEPVAITWIMIVFYLLLVILAFFGNALVIWVVYKYKRMHAAPNFLIVNMAVGDLLMVALNMIPTVVGMLRGTHAWVNDGPFGQVSGKLLAFSQGLSIACSISSLTVLALERFFVVVFPLLNRITIKGTLRSIIGIWVAALALSSPLLYASKVRLNDGVAFCIEDWAPAFKPKRARAIYTIVSFVFLYALPLLIIAVLYSVIATKVWSRRTPGNTTPANHRVSQESRKNVLKMSLAVVLAFAFCWFLMQLIMLLRDFSDVFETCDIPNWLQITGFLLGHGNSAINCCIYPIFCQEYRRGFKQSMKSLFRKHARSAPQNDHEPRAADIPLEGQMIN